ncbi:MAG: 3D domain-containing protein [Planctomycetota bacterium]
MDLQPLSQSAPRRPAGQGKRFNRRALTFVIAAPVSAALLLLFVTWSLDGQHHDGSAHTTPSTSTALVALDTSSVPAPQPIATTPSPQHTPVIAPASPQNQAFTPPAATPAIIPEAGPTFNNRPLRPVRTIRMLTTAYSPDEQSCGIFADGITASGYSVYTNGMALVAADTRLLPFGTLVSIPGYNDGKPVPVLDRGGAIKGKRLDLLYSTHERALQWGAQRLDVVVYEYADE